MVYSSEYRSWSSMLARCTNPKNDHYHNYGGRGIKVCKRWKKFVNFYADMGPKPTPKHSLDRIDVNGNYEPTNCRWATTKEQRSNTRNTPWVTVNGVKKTIAEWAEELGVSSASMRYRIVDAKMDPSVAVSKPPRNFRMDITVNGVTRNLTEWARELGTGASVLHRRIFKNGWDVKTAVTTPVRRITNKNIDLTIDGRTQTIAQWARETNKDPRTIKTRISQYGWSAKQAVFTPTKEE